MGEERKKLGEAELEVMQSLWRAGDSRTAPQILAALETRSWAMGTLITVLQRLTQKGFLTCEKRPRASLYTPLVSQEDYLAGEGHRFLERLYGNSFRSMVASLYGSQVIDAKDIAELQDFLKKLQAERGDAHDA
ncbi:MAG: BlaI/MecI/CopY family transcriptional regulator [Oscillospiraceae bacterium]|jgi:predicted transcriptional regulator|nr:BlaI/MecI/CopY family transcriptional regulator [Oscillospiraceae bacterium]